jgi:hypothetical protein
VIDLTKLTDEEIAFLQFSTERWTDNHTHEQDFNSEFASAVYAIQTAVTKEWYIRNLNYKQFVNRRNP